MENVKAIVSQNILRLRKENNLTQAELARRINYSDKAISRWEAGEVVPDLETIYSLSEVFDVPVSQITEARSEESDEESKKGIGQKILSQIFLCCEIWFIFTAVYVYLKLTKQTNIWQLFVWTVPSCMLVLWVFNRKEPMNILLFIYSSIFVWSFTTCIYLHLIESNPWYIFFIGLPAEGLLIIRYIFNYKQDLKGIRIAKRKAKQLKKQYKP
ncbi:MAG: helix-turn-helix transcriptional regulator [Lachnospiraceae bacterium]|nr:helix-turn-helix transcriptional regulator [Lachnospiraceae bacterium]